MKEILRKLSYLLMASALVSVLASPGYAGMIGTQQLVQAQQVQDQREQIKSALARDEFKQQLVKHGVDVEQAQERIDQLSDSEVQQLAAQFDELPAASGTGEVLLIAGLVVVILELLGVTDIFTGF